MRITMKITPTLAIALAFVVFTGCSTPPPPKPAPSVVVTPQAPEPRHKELSDAELRKMGIRKVNASPAHPIKFKGLMPSM